MQFVSTLQGKNFFFTVYSSVYTIYQTSISIMTKLTQGLHGDFLAATFDLDEKSEG